MTLNSEAMKPCPFCGGEGRMYMPEYPIQADVSDCYVQCGGCDVMGPSVMIDNDHHDHSDWPALEAEAIAAWNRRAPLAALPTGDLVERLNEACNGHPHAKIAWPHYILHEAAAHIQALTAERDGLQRERTNIIATKHEQLATMREAVMDGQYLLGATGLELEAAQASATTAEARVKVLEKALEPFAGYAVHSISHDAEKGWWVIRIPDNAPQPMLSHFASARTALNPEGDGAKPGEA